MTDDKKITNLDFVTFEQFLSYLRKDMHQIEFMAECMKIKPLKDKVQGILRSININKEKWLERETDQ